MFGHCWKNAICAESVVCCMRYAVCAALANIGEAFFVLRVRRFGMVVVPETFLRHSLTVTITQSIHTHSHLHLYGCSNDFIYPQRFFSTPWQRHCPLRSTPVSCAVHCMRVLCRQSTLVRPQQTVAPANYASV